MANISRYNAPEDPFDDLFRGFFMRPVRLEGQQDVQIRINVSEDEKGYTVHAEIPGVKKEDIHVTVEGGLVSISAEVKNEKEVKEGEKFLRSERYFGKVSRSFTVGREIDESAVAAKYTNGVLELHLPKRATARSKRIEIE